MENWSTNSPELSSRVPNPFFELPCLELAPQLLGKGLWHRLGGTQYLAEIVEVEAYLGDDDPASHAYRRRTPRNSVMFERGGACYVYLSYGMNYCMNVVAGEAGKGEAILLRAARPLSPLGPFYKNRGLALSDEPTKLLSGPGKLTRGFGIDLRQNRLRFDGDTLGILDLGIQYSDAQIARGKRIGITKAAELPYRFSVKGSPWLSRKG